MPYVYFEECLFGIDLFMEAYKASNALKAFVATGDVSSVERYKASAEKYFKDFDAATEKKVFIALLELYRKDIPVELQPTLFQTIAKSIRTT